MATTNTVGTIVGNPRPASRTTQVAEAVATCIARGLGAATVLTPVELGLYGPAVFDPSSEAVENDLAAIAAVDVLVVASPTYKATYTGLLKAFFDRYGTNGLAGVVAVPVMVGGVPQHALATEVHLRPLLVELGAVVPSRGLYVLDSELDDLVEIAGHWWDSSAPAVRAAVLSEAMQS